MDGDDFKQELNVDQDQILDELKKCESSPPEFLTIRREDRDDHWIQVLYSDDDREIWPATPERKMKSPFTGEMITVPAAPERKGGKMQIYVLNPSYGNFTETEIKRYKKNFERILENYDFYIEDGSYFYATNDIVETSHVVSSIFRDVYECGGNLEFEAEGDLSSFWNTTKVKTTKKSGSCFVATAVYEDYDHPQVIRLRAFRDHFLSSSALGRILIRIYYVVGPFLAIFPTRSRVTKRLLRLILDRL